MNFFKKNFITAVVASAALTIVMLIIDLCVGANISIKTYISAFFGAFGVCALVYSIIMLFTNVYDEQEDAEQHYNNESVYFYHRYHNGFSLVEKAIKLNNKNVIITFSFIDKDGRFICDEWFDSASEFNEYGTTWVCKNGEFYIINGEGSRISNKFDDVDFAEDEYVKVTRNDDSMINFVDIKTGDLLWNSWKKEL